MRMPIDFFCIFQGAYLRYLTNLIVYTFELSLRGH